MRPVDLEGIIAIGGFFITCIVLGIGIPLVRSWTRRKELEASRPAADPLLGERIARMEASLDAIAVELERIGEGQRFVTKLMAEREPARLPSPERGA